MDLLPTLLHGLAKDSGKPTCPTLYVTTQGVMGFCLGKYYL